jgi:hypothetical protein
MIGALSPLALRELEAWLRADLFPPVSAAGRRQAELGALAEMLSLLPPNPGRDYATIERAE